MPELEGKPEFLDQIAAVSPRVNVEHHTYLTAEETSDALHGVDVLYAYRPPHRLDRANRLRWVQLHFSGIDHVRSSPVFDPEHGIIVSNVAGAHAVPIAEYCIITMGMLLRNFMQLVRDQKNMAWDRMRYLPYELCGSTLGIVGYGQVGRELARQAKAHNMRIWALKNNPQDRRNVRYQWQGMGDPEGVLPERFLGPESLDLLLSECDFVVDCLPHTPETSLLFGEAQFRAMKRGAYFVNVGRGETVDYPALVRVLREGHLGGAALDAFDTDPDPLPPDNPLWTLPNVFISPHISGTRYSHQYLVRTNELFCENLRRFIAGRPLCNVVSLERGY
jgi:phosphoglycerate dehydrogenase-like enzyme